MKESNKVPNPDSCQQTKVKIYLYKDIARPGLCKCRVHSLFKSPTSSRPENEIKSTESDARYEFVYKTGCRPGFFRGLLLRLYSHIHTHKASLTHTKTYLTHHRVDLHVHFASSSTKFAKFLCEKTCFIYFASSSPFHSIFDFVFIVINGFVMKAL